MYRSVMLFVALTFSPALVAAQQPCTTGAREVVNQVYRHMLERGADGGSAHWVQQLENGRMTVRDVVREFQLADARATATVSVADLLSHQSGLSPHDTPWLLTPISRAELFTRLRTADHRGPVGLTPGGDEGRRRIRPVRAERKAPRTMARPSGVVRGVVFSPSGSSSRARSPRQGAGLWRSATVRA